MEDVAVLHNIVLAFLAQLAGVAGSGFAVQGDIVVIGDGLGTDETALEVAMNLACGLRGLAALLDGPGAGFLGADGEEGDEVEEVVAGADDPGETGAKEAGKMRAEGKEYVVQDGDIMLFRFNV